MKKLLAWIIVVCSVLMLIPAGALVYINGWLNGLGFACMMAIPALWVGLMFFRQPFPKNVAIIGVVISLILGGIFTFYSRKMDRNKINIPTDSPLQKELKTIPKDTLLIDSTSK